MRHVHNSLAAICSVLRQTIEKEQNINCGRCAERLIMVTVTFIDLLIFDQGESLEHGVTSVAGPIVESELRNYWEKRVDLAHLSHTSLSHWIFSGPEAL